MSLYLLILLFYATKTNEGKVSNEIFSNLPGITSDVSPLPSVTTVSSSKSTGSVNVSNKTLLRIPILDSKISSLVCFPDKENDYKNVFILSHLLCRMMGFMTFSSIRAKTSPDRARIKSANLSCSLSPRGASQCKSLQNTTESCRMVTEATCGACNGTIKGLKGVIKTPGFPIVSLNDITCEWNIMVPEHHSLVLSFNQFDAMDTETADLPCGLHRPYVQIMYGIQSKVSFHRYCRLNEVKKLNIPFHTVKIIAFTGLQPKQEAKTTKNGHGISITFEATVPSEESYGSPSMMLALFLLGVTFIACLIFCHYVQKYKLCDCVVKGRDKQFLVHPLDRVYDLHNRNKIKIENEEINLNMGHKEDNVKLEIQRNSKMVYESGKGFDEHSNLLESSTGFISSVDLRDIEADKEQLNANLHKKLNLAHSYHGQEDPNRLSVSSPKEYYDYPNFMTSRHASSASCMTQGKKLKSAMSTC